MRSSRWLALPLAVLAVATIVGSTNGGTTQNATKPAVKKQSQAVAVTTLIAEATVQTWQCQDKLIALGARKARSPMQSPWSLPKSPRYRQWVLDQRINKQAACMKRFHYISTRMIPAINDWLGAVQWVQRIYPGTYDWLYTISDREGCRTPGDCPWVWYGSKPWTGHHIGNDFLGADTVGGPLQFRYSTFSPYWRSAQEDLRRRGYIIPYFKMPPAGGDPKYAAWLHPMGQALTGAYMKFNNKEGCHWCI